MGCKQDKWEDSVNFDAGGVERGGGERKYHSHNPRFGALREQALYFSVMGFFERSDFMNFESCEFLISEKLGLHHELHPVHQLVVANNEIQLLIMYLIDHN